MTFTRVKEIFVEAVAAPAEERSAVIRRACAGDSSLRAQVEILLRYHDDAGQFLGTPNPEEETIYIRSKQTYPGSPGEGETSGVMIGRYELLKKIGEGGFGTVWMAQQREPVTRQVALKIVKLGMDTRQVIARFEAERQALAMMDHPNIARVFDAGATETGRPYFVMELCAGDPIVAYCDDHYMSIPQRMQLFVQVCAAVQYAHQKGIIHRDIKPSNILVSTQDGRPSTKVIDFGIAKATGARLTEKTVFTEHRAMIGTLEYMSPEQAEGSLDIDTRTDVYSLGVLLYELLTGSTPFNARDLRSASHAEIQRIICEVEPPTPSTRLSQSRNTLHQVANHRKAVPRRLGTIVRGELDWIVMKALEKDRARRYDTASALAMDIERYLKHDPVLAGPPSSTYRVRKFIRRNKLPVGAAAGIVLALAAGLVISDLQRRRAVRAEQLAAVRLTDAETARDEAERVVEFLTETLHAADPGKEGKEVTVREVMEKAADRVGEKFSASPLIEARLRNTIGSTYRGLGLFEPAQAHMAEAAAIYTRVLGSQDARTLAAARDLTVVFRDLGHFSKAEAAQRGTLEIQRRVLGAEHPDSLQLMNIMAVSLYDQGRYAEAAELQRQTVEIQRRVQGAEHPETLKSMNNLAISLFDRGRYGEAEELRRQTLEIQRRVLGAEHPETLKSMNNLANSLQRNGRYAEAEQLYRQTLEIKRRVLGAEHPDTLVSMSNLAVSLYDQGRYAEAEEPLRQTLEIRRRVLGAEHPETLKSTNNLANILHKKGSSAEAEQLYRQTLEVKRRVLGTEHPETLRFMNSLAVSLYDRGRYAEAEELYRHTVEVQRRVLGTEHPETLKSTNNLANTLRDQGRYAEAEELYRQTLEIQRRGTGAEPGVADTLMGLAEVLEKTQRHPEGQSLCREAGSILATSLPEEHRSRRYNDNLLGGILAGLGLFIEAEPLLIESYKALKSDAALTTAYRRSILNRFVRLYESWDAAEPGKGYAEKAEEWRKKLEEQNTEMQESQNPESQTSVN